MTTPEHAPDASATELPQGRFSGREAFQQLVRDALAQAARQGWREIIISDADFVDWPLGERAVVESLQSWARTGRQFTILARSYEELLRFHPRFVRWRASWDHIMSCRRSPAADPQDLPSALWSTGWGLERLDREHCAGYTGDDPRRRILLHETLDEWLRNKSVPGFPATTLGL